MLNYSHFRASIPPHAGDISSSVTVCFAHSPLSLCVPHVRAVSLLSWSFAHCLCHLYFVNPSLFLCVSPQLTFRWWRLSIYTPQVTTFLEHLAIYLKSSWSCWGVHLFWENLWWLGNTRWPKMDSSFSVNLRRPAVSFKVKRARNKKKGGLLIKYLT